MSQLQHKRDSERKAKNSWRSARGTKMLWWNHRKVVRWLINSWRTVLNLMFPSSGERGSGSLSSDSVFFLFFLFFLDLSALSLKTDKFSWTRRVRRGWRVTKMRFWSSWGWLLREITTERLSDDDDKWAERQMAVRPLLGRCRSSCSRRHRMQRAVGLGEPMELRFQSAAERIAGPPSNWGRRCSCRSWDSSCFADRTWGEHADAFLRLAQRCWSQHRPKWTK